MAESRIEAERSATCKSFERSIGSLRAASQDGVASIMSEHAKIQQSDDAEHDPADGISLQGVDLRIHESETAEFDKPDEVYNALHVLPGVDSQDAAMGETLKGASHSRSAGILLDKEMQEVARHNRESSRSTIISVLMFLVFIDCVGGSMMMTALPFIFREQPGATQAQIDGGMGAFSDFSSKIGFSTCMILGASLSLFGMSLTSAVSSFFVSRVGYKGAFQLYMLGGSLMFLLTGFSKNWPIQCFLTLRFVTGITNGSNAIGTQYVFATDDNNERATKTASLLGIAMAAALLLGPVLGRVCVGNDKDHLFRPFMVMSVMKGVGFIVATIVITPPRRKEKEEDRNSQTDLDLRDDFEKKNYVKWMIVFWVARVFDKIGTVQMHHVINHGMLKYEIIADYFDYVIMGISATFFFGVPLAFGLNRRFGMALTPAIGQLIAGALVVLMKLTFDDSLLAYVSFNLVSYIFTSIGQILENGVVGYLVPTSQRAKWIGYSGAMNMLGLAGAPFCLVQILDREESPLPYNPYGCSHAGVEVPLGLPPVENVCTFPSGAFLYATAIMTWFTMVPYLLLSSQMPSAGKQKRATDSEDADAIKQYESTGDALWLSGKRLHQFNLTRVNIGEIPLAVQCGSFEDDKPELGRLLAAARNDIQFQADLMDLRCFQVEQGATSMENTQYALVFNSNTKWHSRVEEELGTWFVQYLKWAGYAHPGNHARIWKGMIMILFPRIAQHDGEDTTLQAQARSWKLLSRWMRIVLRFKEDVDPLQRMLTGSSATA